MNICAISDLHGNLIPINRSDILFICGDIVPLRIQRNIPQSFKWLKEEFIPWTQSLEVDKIYMVAGNHDFFLENEKDYAIDLLLPTNIRLLYNESAGYYDGEKTWTIWGSPLCHKFGNWAFMPDNDYQKAVFDHIPENLDFLITHDAAYGRNDILLDKSVSWADGSHIGNPALRDALENKHPKFHFTGHLHSTEHLLTEYNHTLTACVSILDEQYHIAYKPLYLEL